MKWQKVSKVCIESVPPGYTISKAVTIRDGAVVTLYQAWKGKRHLHTGTLEECRAACGKRATTA